MDDEDVEHLQRCLAVGLTVWCYLNDVWQKVIAVGGREDEPGPVAYITPRGSGHFVALDACDRGMFEVTTRDLGFAKSGRTNG